MKRFIAFLTVIVGLMSPMTATAYVVSSDGTQVTIQSGDTLWKISADLCGNGAKWKSFKSSSLIRKGEVIAVPVRCHQVRQSPVVRVAGPATVKREMRTSTRGRAKKVPTTQGFWVPNSDPYTGRDTAKAANMLGYHNSSAIAKVVSAGRYEVGTMDCKGEITLRDGTVLRAQAMMYGKYRIDRRTPVHVSCNKNSSHTEAVRVYMAKGEYYVVAQSCGNPIRTVVRKPGKPQRPIAAEKREKEKALSCERIATAWAQGALDGRFINASVRAGCLFDVGPNSKLGPVVGAQIGRYWGRDGWTEEGSFVGLGPEYRTKPGTDLIDSFEVFVLVGPGFSVGGNGETRRASSRGLDAHIGVTMEKVIPVGNNGTTMTVRFMPFAHKALTNRHADLTWQGKPIGNEVARKDVLGAILRLEFDNARWKLRPELTVGGWYVWDVVDPWGAKILVGFSTKDKVWRVGVGAQYAGGGWVPIAEIEYNPILGQMLLSAQAADDTLTKGAKSSAGSLGVKPAPKPKAKVAKGGTRAKAVKTRSRMRNTDTESPFGWAGDVQKKSKPVSAPAAKKRYTHQPSGHGVSTKTPKRTGPRSSGNRGVDGYSSIMGGW